MIVLSSSGGSGVSFQVNCIQEPPVKQVCFHLLQPNYYHFLTVRMTLCSTFGIPNDKTGSTSQMLTPAVSWLTASVIPMGWHEWVQPCSLGSERSNVYDTLQRRNYKGAIAMRIIKHMLKCLVEQVPQTLG